MPPVSESRRKAADKYIKARDNITTRYKPGTKARIQAAADASGVSMNLFIVAAVDAHIERLQAPQSKKKPGKKQ